VDDNVDVLKALAYLLGRSRGIECVGSFTTTKGLSTAITTLHPDVLLLDFSIPGESSLDALRRLKEENPDLSCIVFSGYDDDDLIATSLDAGAERCLPKDVDIPVLVEAIQNLRPARAADYEVTIVVKKTSVRPDVFA